MDDTAAVSEVLDERPELEAPLEAVIAVDDKRNEWTFDDVPVQSGAFGELVSYGLVERTEDGDAYKVADPTAVRATLDNESTGETNDDTRLVELSEVSHSAILNRLATVDTLGVSAVVGGLLAVVLARAYVYSSVFRDGAIVLSGNDPYYYRYWVEQALVASGGVFDFSSLSTMSEPVRTGEPLLVASLWMSASLFGGDTTAAGWVLAWYPVIAAVITGYLVYRLTIVVTDDRRVALVALVLLAVTPAHAFRTSLGFADHHAFDYVWLMITSYALVRLDGRADVVWNERSLWIWVGMLGLGIGGQILAWDGGPLLVAPFAGYVAVRVLYDVRSERAPFAANLPLLGGVAAGTLLVYFGHTLVGWHSDTVAFSPMLLTLGVLGVLGASELAHRHDVSMKIFAAVEVTGSILVLLALRTLHPKYWADLIAGIGRITASRNIAETQSLLSAGTLGWLLLFGFVLVLAVPVLVRQSLAAYRGERRWLVPVIYGWYFLLLAMYQVRFAGQLAMFASVFAGWGFVFIASAVDLTERPIPFAEEQDIRSNLSVPSGKILVQFAVLFLLVAGLSVVQVPIKTSQVVTDQSEYRTASWIDEYAVEQGLEYPGNYVFNQWSNNRMYNYFVNGQSQSYRYAQQNYGPFLSGTDLTQWYKRLNDRVGFVLTEDGVDLGESTIYSHLHNHYGAEGTTLENPGRFKAVYETPNGSYKVFTPVTGALVAGQTSPNGSGTVRTDVELPRSSFVYERQVTGTKNGWYIVRVPYPSTYALVGNKSVSVSKDEVSSGRFANERHPNATWLLSANRGKYVFDQTGGNHGSVSNTEWVTGDGWTGLSFDGNGSVTIPGADRIDGSDGFNLSVRFKIRNDVDYIEDRPFPRIVSKSPNSAYRDTDGYQIALNKGRIVGIVGNGSSATKVFGQSISADRWYNVSLTWNGSVVSLYVNGNRTGTRDFTGSPTNDEPLVFGASSTYNYHFVGSIESVAYREKTQPSNFG